MSEGIENLFDFDLSESQNINEVNERNGRIRDAGICICGHPSTRHTFVAERNRWACQPAKHICTCLTRNDVLEASDIRFFLRTLLGNGAEHAFSRGVAAARAAGIELEIIGTPKCEPCKAEGVPLSPVVVNEAGRVVHDMYNITGHNVFMCRDCQIARG